MVVGRDKSKPMDNFERLIAVSAFSAVVSPLIGAGMFLSDHFSNAEDEVNASPSTEQVEIVEIEPLKPPKGLEL